MSTRLLSFEKCVFPGLAVAAEDGGHHESQAKDRNLLLAVLIVRHGTLEVRDASAGVVRTRS
jgi:hypothetical protein